MTGSVLALLATLTLGSDGDARRWTASDTALQATFVAVTATDWLLTRQALYGANPGHDFHETNPFLGRHPSALRLDVSVAGAVLGHTAVAYLLPRPWRTVWQAAWLGFEATAVYKNYSAGVRIRW